MVCTPFYKIKYEDFYLKSLKTISFKAFLLFMRGIMQTKNVWNIHLENRKKPISSRSKEVGFFCSIEIRVLADASRRLVYIGIFLSLMVHIVKNRMISKVSLANHTIFIIYI
jgi:hypothetical protein